METFTFILFYSTFGPFRVSFYLSQRIPIILDAYNPKDHTNFRIDYAFNMRYVSSLFSLWFFRSRDVIWVARMTSNFRKRRQHSHEIPRSSIIQHSKLLHNWRLYNWISHRNTRSSDCAKCKRKFLTSYSYYLLLQEMLSICCYLLVVNFVTSLSYLIQSDDQLITLFDCLCSSALVLDH
jgi:hypothetical protein